MGIFSGCLLACDIDGTLISNSVFPKRNIERIEYFVSQGGSFSLATGRTPAALSMITSKLNCISPSVLSNGCVIYDFKSAAPIVQKCLPRSSVYLAKEAIECGISMEMHSANRIFVPKRSTASDLHEEYELMKAEFLSFDEAVRFDINKIIYFLENRDCEKTLKKLAQKYENECTFYDTGTVIAGKMQYYYEQIPKGISKAQALLELCGILGIKPGGFFAIGDYYNDVEMLKAADISAAPCEAPDGVKAVADKTVCGVLSGAVADFIDYLEESLKNGQANQIKP